MHDRGLQDDARLLRRRPDVRALDGRLHRAAAAVCQTGRRPWPAGKVWPRDVPNETSRSTPLRTCSGRGRGRCAPTASAGPARRPRSPAGPAIRSGRAHRWRSASTPAASREDGAPILRPSCAPTSSLALPLASEVSAACDGPNRATPGTASRSRCRTDQAGRPLCLRRRRERPPTDRPRRRRCSATASFTSRAARTASTSPATRCPPSCSACAARSARRRPADCCTAEWTGACAAARRGLRPGETVPRRRTAASFTAVTTGWIEAPFSGNYVFEASQQPSRLLINGKKVLDWFETSPGRPAADRSCCNAGQQYHIRWDRLQAEPSAGTRQLASPGRCRGASDCSSIPRGTSMRRARSGHRPDRALPHDRPGFGGVARSPHRRDHRHQQRRRAARSDAARPASGLRPSYSAMLVGEIVPSFTDDYIFYWSAAAPDLTINGAAVRSAARRRRCAPRPAAPTSSCPGEKLDAQLQHLRRRDLRARPVLLRRGIPLVLLDRADLGREVHRRGRGVLPRDRSARAAAAPPGSPQTKSAAESLQAGVHYDDQARVQQPEPRQDDPGCSGRARVRPSRRCRNTRSTRRAALRPRPARG